MKELELLGLGPDGEKLTLNDSEGNRYTLAITDDLRAALRRDRSTRAEEGATPTQMTPREIQAYIREGKTIEEVSEMASLPPSRIEPLAYPIVRERSYTAATARAFLMGSDRGAMSLEELVAGRLAQRGVAAGDIEWDAVRTKGEPWKLLVRFSTADREHTASWHVDFDSQNAQALDEEAIWLSETPILPERTWRAPNTPAVSSLEDAPSIRSADKPAGEEGSAENPSSPSAPSPASSDSAKIDAVLASLDAQRGVPTPMPGMGGAEAEAAEALEADILSLASAPTPADESDEGGTFALPTRPKRSVGEPSADSSATPDEGQASASSASSSEEAPSASAEESSEPQPSDGALFEAPSADTPKEAPKRVRKSNRPSVPTWDEIVFGKKDS